MGTRSGDLDPAIHGHLHRELGWSLDEIDRALNRESGLKGLSGDNDFREVTRRRAAGDAAATLAFDVYAYRVRKYVGAYYAALGELHAVVFTGGVGQHSAELRAAALGGLDRLGIVLDPARNDAPRARTPAAVSADGVGRRRARRPHRRGVGDRPPGARGRARLALGAVARRYEQSGRQRAPQDDDVRAVPSARLTASGCREPRGSS